MYATERDRQTDRERERAYEEREERRERERERERRERARGEINSWRHLTRSQEGISGTFDDLLNGTINVNYKTIPPHYLDAVSALLRLSGASVINLLRGLLL